MSRRALLSLFLLAACGEGEGPTDAAVEMDLSANLDGVHDLAGDADRSNDGAPTDGAPSVDAAQPYVKLPCNVTVGTGSGMLTITSATGSAGDVVCVKAGTYTGGSIKNVSDRTLQNDGGLVTITGHVEIGGLGKITFSGSGDDALTYGWLLSGANATFIITDNLTELTVHHFEALGAGIFLDAGHTNIMWTGTPSGLAIYKGRIDRIHLKDSQQLLQGNYGALDTYLNFMSDLEISNVIVEDSKAQAQNVVGGGGMFNMNVHDWTITAKNDVLVGSIDDRDVGVISIAGSGTFRRLHRNTGWGWLVRNFGVQLGATAGEFHCEDNVDLNSEYYGTCEVRNDEATNGYLVPGKLSTVDIFVQRNVSGHKLDVKGGYTTAIALIPYLKVGTTATLKDNVGCDNAQDYGDMESLHFFQIDGTVIKSNNQQLTSCAGITDPITGLPL